MKYDHKKIEKKIQKRWKDDGIFKVKEDFKKDKFYVLDMFPYPSGEGLHVGHPKGYVATDVYARYMILNGKNVLHPMGFDSFGLPAENYAIKHKIHPQKAVDKNIKRFKKQLDQFGFTYDWDREIVTSDPNYYKWTQWIFLQMYKKGLAYESSEPINWCPSCKTGLANEDLENGKCERCGSQVEKKPIRQWVLKMTDYAERLLDDLKLVDWEKSIVDQQINWIGKSNGSEIEFKLTNIDEKLKVFTTRADTLFGCTYMVISPEHEIISKFKAQISNLKEIEKYQKLAKIKSDLERTDLSKDKTGVKIKGIQAINPANNKEIPIFVADYVLANYGTGAIMAVPAHDERDWEFAKKYKLPIIEVIIPKIIDKQYPPKKGVKVVFRNAVQVIVINPKNKKILCLRWKKFPWTSLVTGGVDEGENMVNAAKREVLEEAGYKNIKYIKTLGSPVEVNFFASHKNENRCANFNALVFELVNEEKHKISKKELEIHAPIWLSWDEIFNDKNFKCEELYIWHKRYFGKDDMFSGNGILINSEKFNGMTSEKAKKQITKFIEGKETVNYKMHDWVFSRQRYWGEPIPLVHCEKCGIVMLSEKDLPLKLPDVKKYEPTGTGESPLAEITDWVNTKCPKCSNDAKRETNTMPQWAGSCWYYLRYIDSKNKIKLVDKKKEKYWMNPKGVDLYVGGAEHATRHLLYARFWHKFLYDIGVVTSKEPFYRLQHVGLIRGEDGRKMSKRWGNVVNPDGVIDEYGADAFRMYEMFMGPFADSVSWSTDGVKGTKRFLDRVWDLTIIISKNKTKIKTKNSSNIGKLVNKISNDIQSFNFNTAVSALMIYFNDRDFASKLNQNNQLESYNVDLNALEKFLQLLSPFAPHITEELWSQLGHKESIFKTTWPNTQGVIKDLVINLAVMVNGKKRALLTIETAKKLSDKQIIDMALNDENVKKHISNKKIKKTIYIPGKIISIVI